MKIRLFLLLFFGYVASQAQPKTADLEKYIEKARTDWQVPGLAVAIVKDGQVVLSRGYGVKTEGSKDKVDGGTLFAIASNTKAFVATALAQLVDDGKLSWNDKVVDHLPWFALYDDYATRHATVEDLLCHRLGLGTFSGDLMWYKSSLTAEEVVKKVKYVPQAYEFRNGYGYSNLMFIAAGEVIAKVSGMPWDEFVTVRILKPLGMQRTIASVSDLVSLGNYATPHKPDSVGRNAPIDWVNWDNMGAAGGLISSSDDMAKWLTMNLSGGSSQGATVVSRAQQTRLWTPHNNHIVTDAARAATPGRHFAGYGLGYSLSDYYGRMMVTHSGGYDGMYSYVMMLPDDNLGIAVLTNTMKGIAPALSYYLANQFIKGDMRDWSAEALGRYDNNKSHYDDVARRRAARANGTQPTVPLEACTGSYWAGLPGRVTVSSTDGKLRFAMADNPGLSGELVHWHYDTWQIRWDETHAWFDFGTVQFLIDNNRKVTGLHFDVPNGDIFFDEVDLVKEK